MKSETEEVTDDDQNQEIYIAVDTTCSVCYAEFLDAEDLDVHIKQMHSLPANPKYCQFCTETYTDMMDYATHVKNVHLLDLRCCRFCTKVFKDGQTLKRHENGHITADTYACSQCTAIFREVILLELHERQLHDNNKDGCFLKCMSCLSSILNLKAVRLLQTVGKKTFECCKCNFSSPNLQTYQQHLVRKKCKVYVCDRCSGVYKGRKNLLQHFKSTKRCMSIEEFSEGVTTTCPDCKTQVHLRLMQCHSKTCKALKCIDCNKVFDTIDDLSVHQMKVHPLDMTLIRCMFCLKEFIGQAPLSRHIDRVHKPTFHLYKYKCMDCDTIYPHPQKLFGHFFSKHKKLEPFTCKICNKKFRVRKAFSLHIKIDHNSVGFVEFDDQYHVFFTAHKSIKPFVPECVVPRELIDAEVIQKKSKTFSIRNQLLDTDTDATNVDTEDEKPLKRKRSPRKMKFKKSKTISKKTKKTKETILIYSSDEEPLLEIRMRALRKRNVNRLWSWKKNLVLKAPFTCNVCYKNCYTYQNHQNHMNLHNQTQEIECVKCSKKFNNKNDLTRHMKKEHASSKLTETLKNLLQKKKHDNSPSNEETPMPPKKPEKFTITMKKVIIDKCVIPATITPVETDLSVKNFLENFTPDINEQKETVKIATDVTITPSVTTYKEPTIKLTKFKDEPIRKQISLKMPERFKQQDHYVKTNITIKLVKEPTSSTDFILPDFTEHNYFDSYQDDDGKNDIPEVAHEIFLEGTDELPTHLATKIVIPKMPKGYSNIHIATLHSEAPFFKIIKVDSEKLTEVKPKEKEVVAPTSDVIDLPDGKKLVTVNPLAHLLGNKPIKSILEPMKNKYYKPAIKNYQGLLAQAMQKLEDPPPRKKRNIAKKPKVTE